MKKLTNILVLIILALVMLPAFSCKRCATCTYDDPVFGQDTSDFCGSGNTYKDQLEQHEKSGWICVED